MGPKHGGRGSHPQATSDQERAQELHDIRRMVEFLVLRERKDDLQTDVAVRRLERLERELSQRVDEERETGLDVALSDKTNVVKLTLDRGFGFGKVQTSEVVFIHASVVQGAEVLVVGTDARAEVISDHARAEAGVPRSKGGGTARVGRREGQRDGEQSGKASEMSSNADCGTGSPVREESLRGMRPPHEPATERSIEPLAAKSSHFVNDGPPRSLFSSTGRSSLLPVAGKSLPREREASTTPQKGHGGVRPRASRPRPGNRSRARRNAEILRQSNW